MFHIYQLDDWVLCRIYKKQNSGKAAEQKVENPIAQNVTLNNAPIVHHHQQQQQQEEATKFPRPCSLTHLWEFGYMGSISHLSMDNSLNNNVPFDHQNSMSNNGNFSETSRLGQVQLPYTDAMKLQGNYQPNFVNPDYPIHEFQ